MSNSIDPDKTAHNEPSHLDLCYLQKLIINPYGSERVKFCHSITVDHSQVVLVPLSLSVLSLFIHSVF